tara:strand:- start:109 stop:483 length:375 start_codon:yes stop_codon:yes gene_type:complete
MASTYNLDISQGETYSIRLNAKDSAGSKINLSGYTARGVIKYRYGNTGYLLDLDPDVVSGTNGNALASGYIDIALTPNQTSNLPVGQFVYDIEISGGTSVFRVVQGKAVVNPEVHSYQFSATGS